jgi:hypothetical protein
MGKKKKKSQNLDLSITLASCNIKTENQAAFHCLFEDVIKLSNLTGIKDKICVHLLLNVGLKH